MQFEKVGFKSIFTNFQHRYMELKLKNCTATRSPHVIEDASRSRPYTGTPCYSADTYKTFNFEKGDKI